MTRPRYRLASGHGSGTHSWGPNPRHIGRNGGQGEGRGRIIRPGGLTGRWVSSPPGVWVHPKPLKGPPTMVTARSDL
eukprot:gene21102-biopygen1085